MGAKFAEEGGEPVARKVQGAFAKGGRPQDKPPAGGFGAERRLRRSRSALRAYLGCAAGVRRGVMRGAFVLTMTPFAIIMELHTIEKESIP